MVESIHYSNCMRKMTVRRKKTFRRIIVLPPLVVLKARHIVQSKLLSAAFSTSSSEWRPWQEAWNHLQIEGEEKVWIRAKYVQNIWYEADPLELTGFLETLLTCHTGGTAQRWCLRCSPPGRWGMLERWHRGHTGCNYSASHTLSLAWWRHTGCRTRTYRRHGGQRSFNPGYFKEDNAD